MCYYFEKEAMEMRRSKKLWPKIILLIVSVSFLIFTGCDLGRLWTGDETEDAANDDPDYTPGTNLPDEITDGTPISLPDGVAANSITGDAASWAISTYPISISLSNSSSQSVTVTFAAGSTFWCKNGDAQNMIIVYDVTINIGTGATATEDLPTYCLNSGLSAPEEEDGFVLGTVYTGGCIGEIINILSTKDPSSFDYYDTSVIQTAVWDCMDYGELTDSSRDALNAL
jgi:hypothetical protein